MAFGSKVEVGIDHDILFEVYIVQIMKDTKHSQILVATDTTLLLFAVFLSASTIYETSRIRFILLFLRGAEAFYKA